MEANDKPIPTLVEAINRFIATPSVDTNLISDGYHTFGELYEHRIELYLCFCQMLSDAGSTSVWKAMKHSDGSSIDGWFILGVWTKAAKQISYHLPIKYWSEIQCPDVGTAPEWDGHTPNDVLKRLAEYRKTGH